METEQGGERAFMGAKEGSGSCKNKNTHMQTYKHFPEETRCNVCSE